jgi:hypothetical protein
MKETLEIGKAIEAVKPENKADLRRCFPNCGWPSSNYVGSDVEEFIDEALPFFTGEQSVSYEISAR